MSDATPPSQPPGSPSAAGGSAAPAPPDPTGDLRAIVESTTQGGEPEFFPLLVRRLAQTITAPYVFVTEFAGGNTRVRTLAFWSRDHLRDNLEYDLADTPCHEVIRTGPSHHLEQVRARFPGLQLLTELGIESYLGAPLISSGGNVLGHLAVLDDRPLQEDERRSLLVRIFADRAALELERLRMESDGFWLEQHCLYFQDEIRSGWRLEEFIAQSPASRAVLDRVRLVAVTDTPVLVLGEIGAGKELITRAVHSLSKRKDRPLIKVDCTALPADAIKNELFGREKSGARPGRLELANGGTLFLDEVAGLPPDVQVRLLHVLQDREFERVGSTTPIKVNVRVIATTNRDLRRLVREEKTFREDLHHRLGVSPILVPPLRDRREDIPLLAQRLVDRFGARIGKHFDPISAATLERLQAYSWPGNVRELENILERAVVLATGPTLEISPELLAVAGPGTMPLSEEQLKLTNLERNHIQIVLEKTRWVIDGPHGAARLLGIHPNTLRSRLKKLGLQRPSQESS